MPNTVKIPAETWLETAKQALIDEGFTGVKIDRLAKSLGVTRGGFYHHFKNHKDLLNRLVKHWATTNRFLPDLTILDTPLDAVAAFDALADHLIAEKKFSPAFEMAVREWARIDSHVNRTVDKVDAERISKMTTLFLALGCDEQEATIRANSLYFNQMGYYSLGYHLRQSKAERVKNTPIYMRIICGRRYLEAVEQQARKWT
ncbi:MAG: TetR/AcrR family transcriptional regulator [Pseudomonadota bacterium]